MNTEKVGSRISYFAALGFAILSALFCIQSLSHTTTWNSLRKMRVHNTKFQMELDLRENRIHSLEKAISNKTMALHAKEQRIRTVEREMEILKKRIIDIDGFEKRVRMAANIERGKTDHFSGMGGDSSTYNPAADAAQIGQTTPMDRIEKKIRSLEMASIQQMDRFSVLLEDLKKMRNRLKSIPSIRPASGTKTSGFGFRSSPFTGKKEFHKGIDIAAPLGTPVFSTANGRIIFSGYKLSYGNLIIIDHGGGFISRYAHLSTFFRIQGNRVKKGEKIASMGNTGRSTGPHLHYEIRLNGVAVDPENYMSLIAG